jgi:hypothetical protein
MAWLLILSLPSKTCHFSLRSLARLIHDRVLDGLAGLLAIPETASGWAIINDVPVARLDPAVFWGACNKNCTRHKHRHGGKIDADPDSKIKNQYNTFP